MEKSHRIEYLDALRGVTMILVVYSHILFHCFNFDYTAVPSFNSFFSIIRMPIFFFISGFIMYKGNLCYNFRFVKSFLYKKFKVQIISTLVFMLAFSIIFHESIVEMLFSPTKGGFWFTITLFAYFLLYFILRGILNCVHECKKRGGEWIRYGVVVVYALAIELLTYNEVTSKLGINAEIVDFLGLAQLRFFKYFLFGVFIKKYYDKFISFTNNNWGIPLVFMSFIILIFLYYFGVGFGIAKIIPFLAIMIVLTYFRKNEKSLSKENPIGKILQYIGTRTLDIYLLHVFILPVNLSFIGDFLVKYNNPLIELFLALLVSLLVIGMCLLISSFLRINPIMANFLFGVKIRKYESIN